MSEKFDPPQSYETASRNPYQSGTIAHSLYYYIFEVGSRGKPTPNNWCVDALPDNHYKWIQRNLVEGGKKVFGEDFWEDPNDLRPYDVEDALLFATAEQHLRLYNFFRSRQEPRMLQELPWFQSAASGLWYRNVHAAGSVATIQIQGMRIELRGDINHIEPMDPDIRSPYKVSMEPDDTCTHRWHEDTSLEPENCPRCGEWRPL